MSAPVLASGQTQVAAPLGTKVPVPTLIGPTPDPTRSLQLMAKSVTDAQSHPMLNSKMVTVAIPANATQITLQHGLGYTPNGCQVLKTTQPLLITMPGGETDPTKTLNLNVNAGGFTATFLVI